MYTKPKPITNMNDYELRQHLKTALKLNSHLYINLSTKETIPATADIIAQQEHHLTSFFIVPKNGFQNMDFGSIHKARLSKTVVTIVLNASCEQFNFDLFESYLPISERGKLPPLGYLDNYDIEGLYESELRYASEPLFYKELTHKVTFGKRS